MNTHQSPSRRRFALKAIPAAALVLALGGALFWMLADDSASRGGDAAADRAGQGAADTSLSGTGDAGDYGLETAAELLEYRMRVGRAYSYVFRRSLDARMQGEVMVDLTLGGVLTPNVVRERDGRMDLIMRVRFEETGDIPVEDLPYFAASGAATPEYLAHLQIDRSGRPLLLRFPDGLTSPAEQGLIRDVLATWIQPLPDRGAPVRANDRRQSSGGGSWSFIGLGDDSDERPAFLVDGTDTQGQYQGALSLRDSDIEEQDDLHGFAYDLSKERYSESLTPIAIESSDHAVDWQLEHGVFRDSEGVDRLRMGPSDFLVDSETRYS